jgi:hypothetical protein
MSTLHMRQQSLVLRIVHHKSLDGTAHLHESSIPSRQAAIHISYHCILSHKNDSLTTETQTDLVHLLGADIVHSDDED